MDPILDILLNFYGPVPYLILFGILFLCGIGLPIPEDVTLFAAGLSVYYGLTDLYLTVAICYFGVMIGDTLIFSLGHKYGRKLTKKWFFHKLLPDERLNSVQKKLHSQGNKLIFAARFMPGLRAPIYFSAGTLHLPYRIFFFYDGLAALLSVPAIVGLVYHYGDELDHIVRVIQGVERGVIVVIIFVAIALKWFWTRRSTQGKVEE